MRLKNGERLADRVIVKTIWVGLVDKFDFALIAVAGF